MILKLELSTSSPVATSLEVSMPHQPATLSFPKCQFSKSMSVVRSFQVGCFRSWSCIDRYIIMRSQIVMVPFALYVCAMEKIPSGNADTAFVSNCDHDYNQLMGRIIKVLCIVPMYKCYI